MKLAAARVPRPGSCLGAIFALVAVLASTQLTAQAEQPAPPIPRDDPEAMVREATTRLLDTARAARSYAKQDPERYYAAVEDVLAPVLDMRFFARSVMATWASQRLYNSLETDAEKTAFRERVDRFVGASRRVFLIKYADAVLNFEGERIDVTALPTPKDDPDHASVQQIIYDVDDRTYKVQYSLRRGKDGDWLVGNVIVEGVNLGQIYRNQFAEAVEKNRGDVDYVVDHWEVLMTQNAASGEGGGQ
jgi:phospholipid transport system substrate-binding protein